MSRDYGNEIDGLHKRLGNLEQLMGELLAQGSGAGKPSEASLSSMGNAVQIRAAAVTPDSELAGFSGALFYAGHMSSEQRSLRWEPQDRSLTKLMAVNSEKAAKVLAALGHKQRLDILIAIMQEPLTGLELVEKLGMGTTGQLYHHLKALTGADLLTQEERGGRYSLSEGRELPFALLLAAVADVLDTSDYIEMTQARHQASSYLGQGGGQGYDPHQLLWAVMDNSVREHLAGFCSEIRVYLHQDGSVTVADNGRGIPVIVLPHTEKPAVQAVLTDFQLMLSKGGTDYYAPGGDKGIGMPIVNALSQSLTIEIRREGKIFRQHYRQGIPLSDVQVVGATNEQGTSVTWFPSPELFRSGLDRGLLVQRQSELAEHYPSLSVIIEAGDC